MTPRQMIVLLQVYADRDSKEDAVLKDLIHEKLIKEIDYGPTDYEVTYIGQQLCVNILQIGDLVMKARRRA